MSETQNPLPINTLILARSEELALSRSELVKRAGYTNIAKGLRRPDELLPTGLPSSRTPCVWLTVAKKPYDDIVGPALLHYT